MYAGSQLQKAALASEMPLYLSPRDEQKVPERVRLLAPRTFLRENEKLAVVLTARFTDMIYGEVAFARKRKTITSPCAATLIVAAAGTSIPLLTS